MQTFEKAQLSALEEAAEEAAAFLRSAAHPARLRVLCALLDGDCAAGELARRAGLSAPSLSQQAAVLEAGGLLRRRRESRSIVYGLATPHVAELVGFLHRVFCADVLPAERRRESPHDPRLEARKPIRRRR